MGLDQDIPSVSETPLLTGIVYPTPILEYGHTAAEGQEFWIHSCELQHSENPMQVLRE